VDPGCVEGNEVVDEQARYAALNGAVFESLFPQVDFQGLARSVFLREWQGKWNAADTGRFAHSILPKVSLQRWFECQREFKSTVSRIMSGRCTARSHLSRFRTIDGAMYMFDGEFSQIRMDFQLTNFFGKFYMIISLSV
jgi:hypothetical protein